MSVNGVLDILNARCIARVEKKNEFFSGRNEWLWSYYNDLETWIIMKRTARGRYVLVNKCMGVRAFKQDSNDYIENRNCKELKSTQTFLKKKSSLENSEWTFFFFTRVSHHTFLNKYTPFFIELITWILI